MEQTAMFISFMMIEVNKIFNVEMRADIFYILQRGRKKTNVKV